MQLFNERPDFLVYHIHGAHLFDMKVFEVIVRKISIAEYSSSASAMLFHSVMLIKFLLMVATGRTAMETQDCS